MRPLLKSVNLVIESFLPLMTDQAAGALPVYLAYAYIIPSFGASSTGWERG